MRKGYEGTPRDSRSPVHLKPTNRRTPFPLLAPALGPAYFPERYQVVQVVNDANTDGTNSASASTTRPRSKARV